MINTKIANSGNTSNSAYLETPMYINGGFVPLKGTRSGIDKLTLTSRDFEVKDTKQLSIQPNVKKQGENEVFETPLFNCDGKVVQGSKAYHNSDFKAGNLSVSINGWQGMKIDFNPSKMLGKITGDLATIQDVKNLTSDIESYLRNNGLNVSLNDTSISRIDFAKDCLMEDKVFSYQQVFNLLRAKGYNKKYGYHNGVLIGNKTKQGVFYDKGFEIDPRSGDSQNMRGEVRFLNSEIVCKKTGFKNLSDLYYSDQEHINQVYSDFINSDVYNLSRSGQLTFDFMGEVELLRKLKDQGRNAFKNWIAIEGIEAKIIRIGSIDNMKRILLETFTRSRVNGYLKEAEELLRLKRTLNIDSTSLSHKYEEIRLKFAS